MTAPKKSNRTEYYRKQKKAYRAKHKTVSVSFTKDVAKELARGAAAHHLSLPTYIKACVTAYRNQTFIIPDQSQVQAIEVQLKGIGNNINQIARRVNQRETEPCAGVAEVRKQLTQLEQQFNRIIRTPWNLETYINQCLTTDPSIIPMLLRILTAHHHAYQKNIPSQ